MELLYTYDFLFENCDVFDIYEDMEELLTETATIKDVERMKDGRIKYRGEIFDGFNNPKRYKGNGKFKFRVLASENGMIKIVNFGHVDYEDYTTHHDSERKKNFRKRHKCDIGKLSKLTRRYWSCQYLWNKKSN